MSLYDIYRRVFVIIQKATLFIWNEHSCTFNSFGTSWRVVLRQRLKGFSKYEQEDVIVIGPHVADHKNKTEME